ncbi:MAG: hypothetical protein JO131_05560 [Gammaproteobacteria bacterium]|nr:hypothetical protein [Gammaproteobacteria bacterium]
MKIFSYVSVVLLFFYPIYNWADCPPASAVTITKNNDGTYNVIPPPGYIYGGANAPIKATSPISLAGVQLSGSPIPNEPSNLSVGSTACFYGIAMSTPGTYPGGIVVVYKNQHSVDTLNTPSEWTSNKDSIWQCPAFMFNCYFIENSVK